MSKRFLYHIGFWAVYVLFKSYLNFSSSSLDISGKSGIELFVFATLIQLILLLVKIPLVYSLFYVTDNYLSKRWSFLKTTSITIALFLIAILFYLIVNQVLINKLVYKTDTNLWASINSLNSISYCFFILAFVSGIAFSIKLIRLNIKQKIESQEVLKKKLEIELQFLKAQTNPHFLFNTLNNIYALARKNSNQTAEVVMKLSEMLRYMLYETSSGAIEIEKEIQIINDYIELEKLRYSNKLEIIFNHSVTNYKEKIAPLILLPFVENAFKHGAGESRFDSYIYINLNVINNELDFEIKNSKEQNTTNITHNKIGLNNIKRQLELIYPNHKLTFENTENEFIVNLKINLNNGKI